MSDEADRVLLLNKLEQALQQLGKFEGLRNDGIMSRCLEFKLAADAGFRLAEQRVNELRIEVNRRFLTS
jgi:hypothetical protein